MSNCVYFNLIDTHYEARELELILILHEWLFLHHGSPYASDNCNQCASLLRVPT